METQLGLDLASVWLRVGRNALWRREHHAAPRLNCLDGGRRGEVALAGAGRSEQMNVFGQNDEGQVG